MTCTTTVPGAMPLNRGSLLTQPLFIKFKLEDAKGYPGEAVAGKTQAQNHFSGAAHTWPSCPPCMPGARTWGQGTHSPNTPETRQNRSPAHRSRSRARASPGSQLSQRVLAPQRACPASVYRTFFSGPLSNGSCQIKLS